VLNTALKRHFKQVFVFVFFFGRKKKKSQPKKIKENYWGGEKVQPPVWRSDVPSGGGDAPARGGLAMAPIGKTAPKAHPPQPTGLPKCGG